MFVEMTEEENQVLWSLLADTLREEGANSDVSRSYCNKLRALQLSLSNAAAAQPYGGEPLTDDELLTLLTALEEAQITYRKRVTRPCVSLMGNLFTALEARFENALKKNGSK